MGNKIAWNTVHDGKKYNYNNKRFNKAKEEKDKKNVELNEEKINKIVTYCKKSKIIIEGVWLKETENYVVQDNGDVDLIYDEIKDIDELNDERDIVWIKFANDINDTNNDNIGYVGVVASSNDINFQIPKDENKYDIKLDNGKWKYNSSGIIVHHLNLKWNTSSVLVFLIKEIDGMTRHGVEKMIGNYLTKILKVPVLDYYSHRIGGK